MEGIAYPHASASSALSAGAAASASTVAFHAVSLPPPSLVLTPQPPLSATATVTDGHVAAKVVCRAPPAHDAHNASLSLLLTTSGATLPNDNPPSSHDFTPLSAWSGGGVMGSPVRQWTVRRCCH